MKVTNGIITYSVDANQAQAFLNNGWSMVGEKSPTVKADEKAAEPEKKKATRAKKV